MVGITIKKSSVVSPMLSSDGMCIKGNLCSIFSDINRKCKEELVEINFFDEKVKIVGRHSVIRKVPAKCLKNDFFLAEWIYEQIKKAWL